MRPLDVPSPVPSEGASAVRSIGSEWRPHLALVLVALFAHWVLLTSEAAIWDSWYLLAWIREKNFPPMDEFFGAVGMPLYGWVYRPFSACSNPAAALMMASFACLAASGNLGYSLLRRLGNLTQGEALMISLIAVALPVFNAAQDAIMFFFLLTQVLFLGAALMMVHCWSFDTLRKRLGMGLSILLFWVSFSNAALLVFFGGFYAFLWVRFASKRDLSFLRSGWRFVRERPVIFFLPMVSWTVRRVWMPQYGWYEFYNSPLENLGKFLPNFWTFFANVPWFHTRSFFLWPTQHPILAFLTALLCVLWWRYAPKHLKFSPPSTRIRHLLGSGLFLLFLAIFPFAAAGKHFTTNPVGEESHYLYVASLPLAFLLFALVRGVARMLLGTAEGRAMIPMVGVVVMVGGTQLWDFYVAEQSEWICNRAVLHQVAQNETVKRSSVVFFNGSSMAKQCAYAIYGFGEALGGITRCVTPAPPENQRFYTPSEIQRTLFRTTLLPNEFRNVNPAGAQVGLEAQIQKGRGTPWDIFRSYQSLRWLGKAGEMEDWLEALCTLKTVFVRSATRCLPAPAAQPRPAPSEQVSDQGFVNGVGMEMLRIPRGWWAAKTEVTQAEYREVMGSNPSLFEDPARPVERVSWNDAAEFCRRITASEHSAGRIPAGMVYRLPTAEEFTVLLTGGSSLDEAVTSAKEIQWHTAPVASRKPNAFGLVDVLGNVWEWCWDSGDSRGRMKVSMGGAWNNYAWELTPHPPVPREAGPYQRAFAERLFGMRRMDYPDQAFWDRGFRCVLAFPADKKTP
jgi:hypothetical protein